MKRYFTKTPLLLAFACLFPLPMFLSSSAQEIIKGRSLAKNDELAISKLIMAVEVAWNSHDMQAYGQLLHGDVVWINIVGMHWRGREDVVAAHVAFHETIFKDHSIKTDSVEIRSIGEGVAIAVVTTTNDAFRTPDGNLMPKSQNRLSYVLAKDGEGWKIIHGHNVVVNAEAARNNPVNAVKD